VKHIGILAHSAEGATLCYREAWLEGVRRLGAHMHPEITLTGVAMATLLDAWESNDLPTLRAAFMRDAQKLAAAGADFFVCPDNTAHLALESPGEPFPIPCLHIGEVVADRALLDGRSKIGILGTKWTMTGPVYPGAFGRRGMSWAIPDEDDRKTIDDIIFGELCLGVFTEESRDAYVRIIGKMAEEGCDSVALVCTEIPLLVSEDVSPLPVLDSTRLLARAAVAVALGDRPMPEWRGGSVAQRIAAE
jgi:aspartate racemase